ncbi:MAG: CBS domain-containing protein [Gammaproteobacteria bacterium]|nr:CBS domain-containing protein [Gammaproteobacteria bacterium]NIR58685.1 CBS domain-containing protein [Gammaproteobacteria bacterium]NIR90345.1 CBS domain-containing protein [Gammaproteobacteria bacterium]
MKVGEIMTHGVRTCTPESSLEDAALIMWDGDCGAVPVIDHEGRPVGVITDRDIAMGSALQHKSLSDIRVSDVINGRPAHLCHVDDDIKNALKTMWGQKVRRLPVVGMDGRVLGILSIDDVITHAERGSRGQTVPDLSFDDAMNTLKAVARYHL